MNSIDTYLTKEETRHLWGQPVTNRDYLVSEVHGDGKQYVWFETMDSRPFAHIVKVDSSLEIDADDYDILTEEENNNYGCFSEMLMQMIEEEYDSIDRYPIELENGHYTNEQDQEEGYEPVTGNWPMFSLGAGYSYGRIDIEEIKSKLDRI